MATFSIEVPANDPEKMAEFQKVMDEIQDAQYKYIKDEAAKLGVSEACASDIVYLRSRSRWTLEAEAELIRRDKAGESLPNIYEWP
jgi:hypothetical protein